MKKTSFFKRKAQEKKLADMLEKEQNRPIDDLKQYSGLSWQQIQLTGKSLLSEEEPKHDKIKAKKRIRKSTPHIGKLPLNIWSQLFAMSSYEAGANLALTCKGANQRWQTHLTRTNLGHRRLLIDSRFLPESLLEAAENKGIQLKYSVIYHYFLRQYPVAIQLADLPDNMLWPLAALSHDIAWLAKNLGKEKIAAVTDLSAKSVPGYLAFSGGASGEIALLERGLISQEDIHRHLTDIYYSATVGGNQQYFKATGRPLPENILSILLRSNQLHAALDLYGVTLAKLAADPEKKAISQLSLDAARYGHLPICDELEHKYGAKTDASVRDAGGACHLHFAAKYDDIRRIEKWTGIGIPKDSNGWEPAQYAASGGAIRALCYLMDKDASLQKFDLSEPNDIFRVLARYRHTSLVFILADRYRLNIRQTDENGDSLIAFSAQGGDSRGFELLMEAGLPRKIGTNRKPTLFHAASHQRLRLFYEIINKFGEEDLNSLTAGGNSAGLFLMLSQNIVVVENLSSHFDIDFNQLNNHRRNPIHEYVHCRSKDPEAKWAFIRQVIDLLGDKLAANWQDEPDDRGVTFQQMIPKENRGLAL